MPTTTTAALSAVKINQGDPVSILASTASSRADTTADVKGVMEVHAARAGSDEFTQITELPYPGGKQQVSLSLQEWASTHPGFWTIRTVNHGTGIADGSASDTSLQVVAPGAARSPTPRPSSTLGSEHRRRCSAPRSRPQRRWVRVTVAVSSGSVAFAVGGRVVATVPLSAAGTATTTVGATVVVGDSSVTAAYLGTTEYAASASAARTLTGLKAATTTTATAPTGTGPARRRQSAVRVTATGSSVVPTGMATVSEGGTRARHGPAHRGRRVVRTADAAGRGPTRSPSPTRATRAPTGSTGDGGRHGGRGRSPPPPVVKASSGDDR